MYKKIIFFFSLIAISFSFKAIAQSDYEKQTLVFAKDLAAKIKEKKKTKIAVSDFLDNDENLTELGKAIAEEISVNIVNEAKDSFQVMERGNLKSILKEQKLASTGLIDPETAKKLGKLKAVDAVIVGNITPFGNSFRITLKVLDTETGMSIAASSGNISGTEDIKSLFAKKIIISGIVPTTFYSETPTYTFSQSENNPSRDIEGCKQGFGTGDYCFYNSTDQKLVVAIQGGSTYYITYDDIVLNPKETKCTYSRNAGVDYTFYVCKYEGFDFTYREKNVPLILEKGSFQTLKCKSLKYTIK